MLVLHEIADPLILVDDVNPIDIMNCNRHRRHNVLSLRVNGKAITGLLWNQILQASGVHHISVRAIGGGMPRSTAAAADKACSDRAFDVCLISSGPKSAGLTTHSVYMVG